MAQTINGMIARENNSEDFLSDENWTTFVEKAEKIGCFIIGRKTYDEVKKWKDYNFDSIKAKKIIVSSNNLNSKDFTIVNSPKEAVEKAKELGFKKVLVTGGGSINSSFMKAKLVDEIIIKIESFVLGKGIKVFASEDFEAKLELIKVKKLTKNIVELNYKVNKNTYK